MPIHSLSDITNIFYINLEHRTDRKQHVEQELQKIGLNATRFNAIQMPNGAIGCSMSHLKILQEAIKNKLDHVLIVEDDIQFLNPELFKTNINRFFETQQSSWDVVLLAGNNMPPYEQIANEFVKVSRCQTTTGYLVNGHYINTLLQNIKAGLTHLIHKPEEHSNYAIDKYWFKLQQVDNWYLIIPLTVVQRADYSDIEKRITDYAKIMTDLDKTDLIKESLTKQKNLQKQLQIQKLLQMMPHKQTQMHMQMK